MTKDYTEELRDKWLKEFQPPERVYLNNPDNKLSCPICGVKAEEIADWWLSEHLSYAKMRDLEIKEWKEKVREMIEELPITWGMHTTPNKKYYGENLIDSFLASDLMN